MDNLETEKAYTGLKPSVNNKSHIFSTKFIIITSEIKIININAMKNSNIDFLETQFYSEREKNAREKLTIVSLRLNSQYLDEREK
jgi:hypothetical protein